MEGERKTISVIVLLLLIFYSIVPTLAVDSTGSSPSILDKITSATGAIKDKAVDFIQRVLPGDTKTATTTQETAKPVTTTGGTSGSSVPATTEGKTVSLDEARVNETQNNTDDSILPDSSQPDKEDSYSPLDMGKQMVGEGILYGFDLLADQGFKVGFNTTNSDQNSVKQNYGMAVGVIYALATVEFDPSDNPFIQEIQIRMNLIGLFLILFFVLMGAINVNWYAVTSAQNRAKAYILSNRYHVPVNEYGVTIVEACLMMVFGYVILRISLMVELVFTKLIMLQILDRIAPTGENTILYIMMSICYVLMSIAIGIRLLEIAFFHCSYLVFIGLYCYGATREVAISSFMYYLKILFLRPIIVGITVIGVGVISSIKISPDINPVLQVVEGMGILYIVPIMYAGLILILLIVSIKVIFGITSIFRTSRQAYRTLRYGINSRRGYGGDYL